MNLFCRLEILCPNDLIQIKSTFVAMINQNTAIQGPTGIKSDILLSNLTVFELNHVVALPEGKTNSIGLGCL